MSGLFSEHVKLPTASEMGSGSDLGHDIKPVDVIGRTSFRGCFGGSDLLDIR